jgi:hypothetical protein
MRNDTRFALVGVSVIVLIITLSIVTGFTGIGPNYSNGERVGIVTKLSEKGVIFKSWEGELLMALPIDVAGTTQPEKFAFNVEKACVERMNTAMKESKRVTLIYRQWWSKPNYKIDHDYVVTDIK